ncbi:MAG TPA: cytochrome P450 [Myxococcota bacterium]|nr:cytochrome P450 [Myxococcota bacterium]
MRRDYDPFAQEFRSDPYPHYAALRSEAPVYWAAGSKTWVVSRHDDVVRVLKDPEGFSSDAMATVLVGGSGGPQPGNLVTHDPPSHTRLRRIVNRAFTPRRVEAWRPMVEARTDAAVAAMRASRRFDVVRDLAVPIPVTVIAEILGIGAERRDDFKRWADTITAGMTGSKRHLGFVESGAVQAGLELAQHLGVVIAQRTSDPADDLVSDLVRAQEGELLEPVEVLGFAGVLTFAGTETTTNLIGNAVRVLIEQPAVREQVMAQPSLVSPLIEETLRWDSPVQYVFRRATAEVEVAGRVIPAGEIVTVLLGSANRDEARWGPDAAVFDLHRDASGHLGFGIGVHFCLGAALARMEAEVALARLLPVLEESRFVGGELCPIDSLQFRGVRALEFEAT